MSNGTPATKATGAVQVPCHIKLCDLHSQRALHSNLEVFKEITSKRGGAQTYLMANQ